MRPLLALAEEPCPAVAAGTHSPQKASSPALHSCFHSNIILIHFLMQPSCCPKPYLIRCFPSPVSLPACLDFQSSVVLPASSILGIYQQIHLGELGGKEFNPPTAISPSLHPRPSLCMEPDPSPILVFHRHHTAYLWDSGI